MRLQSKCEETQEVLLEEGRASPPTHKPESEHVRLLVVVSGTNEIGHGSTRSRTQGFAIVNQTRIHKTRVRVGLLTGQEFAENAEKFAR